MKKATAKGKGADKQKTAKSKKSAASRKGSDDKLSKLSAAEMSQKPAEEESVISPDKEIPAPELAESPLKNEDQQPLVGGEVGEPSALVNDSPKEGDDQSLMVGEKVTLGTNLNQNLDADMKSMAQTEKMGRQGSGDFYDKKAENFDNKTDIDKNAKEEKSDDEGLGFMDDEEIQPKQTMGNQFYIEKVTESWKLVQKIGYDKFGPILFKNLFKIQPDLLQLFSFKDEANLYQSEALKKHAKIVTETVGQAVAGLVDLASLIPILTSLGKKHKKFGIMPEHYPVLQKALFMTLEQGLKKRFTQEIKTSWERIFEIISDTMISDHYDQGETEDDEQIDSGSGGDLNARKISLIQDSWELVKGVGFEYVGVEFFRNLFKLEPTLINLFTHFRDEKDLYNSHFLKTHATKVIETVGKAVAGLHDIDSLLPVLKTLGEGHVPKGVKREHLATAGEALMITLEEQLGEENFRPPVRKAWTQAFE